MRTVFDGRTLLRENLLVQAEYWYRESARKEKGITPRPLLGLLRVKLSTKEEDQAEALILAIEKSNLGTIEGSGLSQDAAALLRKRRFGDLFDRGYSPKEMTVTELSQALLGKSAGDAPASEGDPVSRPDQRQARSREPIRQLF